MNARDVVITTYQLVNTNFPEGLEQTVSIEAQNWNSLITCDSVLRKLAQSNHKEHYLQKVLGPRISLLAAIIIMVIKLKRARSPVSTWISSGVASFLLPPKNRIGRECYRHSLVHYTFVHVHVNGCDLCQSELHIRQLACMKVPMLVSSHNQTCVLKNAIVSYRE